MDLLASLKKDVQFMKANHLMDYSFLYVKGKNKDKSERGKDKDKDKDRQSGFSRFRKLEDIEGEYCYSFSIIDYLQKYSTRKRMENAIKRVFYYSTSQFVSCVHPDLYANRFLDFIKPIFKGKDRKNQKSIDRFLKKNQ